MTSTFRLAETKCPCCQTRFDAASNMQNVEPPAQGDMTVCLYCASVLQFDSEIIPRALGADELAAIYAGQSGLEDEIANMVSAIKMMQREAA